MTASLPSRALLFGWLALTACSSSDSFSNGPPVCGFDGGGPVAATEQFTAFLTAATIDAGCVSDSDCVLVQTPCQQAFQTCDFTQVAVPVSWQAAAIELASTLTAEQCPASCTTSMFTAPIGGDVDCSVFATPAPVCVDGGAAAVCAIGAALPLDAGAGNFESFCAFLCAAGQFCDISALETACPDPSLLSPGIYQVVSSGQLGICAPVFAGEDGDTCFTDSECSQGDYCQDQSTDGPCSSAGCQDGGGVCHNACPAALPSCPGGCQGPIDDGRHCQICDCGTCPAG